MQIAAGVFPNYWKRLAGGWEKEKHSFLQLFLSPGKERCRGWKLFSKVFWRGRKRAVRA